MGRYGYGYSGLAVGLTLRLRLWWYWRRRNAGADGGVGRINVGKMNLTESQIEIQTARKLSAKIMYAHSSGGG